MIDYRMTDNRTMELHVSGRITKEEIDEIWRRMKADIPAEGKVRVLETIGELKGIEPAAFWEDLKLGLPMMHCVERAAVVSDRGWIEALSKVSNVFLSAEIRTFEPERIEEARAWLKSA